MQPFERMQWSLNFCVSMEKPLEREIPGIISVLSQEGIQPTRLFK